MLRHIALLLFVVGVVLSLPKHDHDHVHSPTHEDQVKIKKLYDSIVTPEYNLNVRPADASHLTTITARAKELEVINVDKDKGLFTFTGYFGKEWIDPRLAYNDTSIPYIKVRDYKPLWAPYFYTPEFVDYGLYPLDYHKVPRIMKIYPNGKVFMGLRSAKTVRCKDLYKDQKETTCSVRFGPFDYLDTDVQMKWATEGVSLSQAKDGFVPGYNVQVIKNDNCDNTMGPDKKLSCVQMDFKFTKV